MKKALVIVGILIAGVVYADNSRSTMREVPVTYESSLPCCGPQPEDIRSYFVDCEYCPSNDLFVIIPEAEGTNGFMITDFVVAIGATSINRRIRLYENGVHKTTAKVHSLSTTSINFASGIPVAVGSEITFDTSGVFKDTWITLSGYVY